MGYNYFSTGQVETKAALVNGCFADRRGGDTKSTAAATSSLADVVRYINFRPYSGKKMATPGPAWFGSFYPR